MEGIDSWCQTNSKRSRLRVQASSVVRNFAEKGFGVALIPERIVLESLPTEHPIKLQMPAIPMKHDYLVAHAKRLEPSRAVQVSNQALKA